jgi:hypothetical protein
MARFTITLDAQLPIGATEEEAAERIRGLLAKALWPQLAVQRVVVVADPKPWPGHDPNCTWGGPHGGSCPTRRESEKVPRDRDHKPVPYGCLRIRRMSVVLAFTLDGRITSNNFVKTGVPIRRRGKPAVRMLKTKGARDDQAFVAAVASIAAATIGWQKPAAASLEIIAWNTRKDVGNIEKVIADGMIGIAYDDDRVLVSLRVEKRKDIGGERYDVTVRPADPLVRVKARLQPVVGNKPVATFDPPPVPTSCYEGVMPRRRARTIDDLKSGDEAP